MFSLAALTSAYVTKAAHINADVQRFHLASCLGLGARGIRSAITATESIPIEDFLPIYDTWPHFPTFPSTK